MSKAEKLSVQGDEPQPWQTHDADVDEHDLPPPYTPPERSKTPSRCYNASFIVVYFALLIMAVVALGSFGAKQADINAVLKKRFISTKQSCILFTTYSESDGFLQFHANGPCGYVFYGLASISIVAFVWLVGSIVQTAIGPKVISIVRIFDLIAMVLSFLLSLSLSVTIHVGLNATCQAFVDYNPTYTHCPTTFFTFDGMDDLHYYTSINIAKSSSWATTVLLLALSAWYIILCISYCYTVKRRRQQRVIYEDEGNMSSALV